MDILKIEQNDFFINVKISRRGHKTSHNNLFTLWGLRPLVLPSSEKLDQADTSAMTNRIAANGAKTPCEKTKERKALRCIPDGIKEKQG